MTRFHIDSEAVAAATANAQAAASRIQSDVQALHARLTELEGSWSGQAAAAFQGVVAEWAALQRQVDDGLARLGTALGAAGRHYADVEAQNARLFAG